MNRRRKNPPGPSPWLVGAASIGAIVAGGALARWKLQADIAAGKFPSWPQGSTPRFLDFIYEDYVSTGAALGAGAALVGQALTPNPKMYLVIPTALFGALSLSLALEGRAAVQRGQLRFLDAPSTPTLPPSA